jgi:23S rRNA (pseudouridine1915-N3)-methyltransferase
MYKLRILSIGKTKEEWLETAIVEYLKRLLNTATIEFVLAKNNEQLEMLVKKEKAVICLDSTGSMMDSPKFSSFLIKQLEANGSRLAFVIGGANGLPKSLKVEYPLISFSPMTFTHQIIRLILIEQIYRAMEIDKGSQYHKS